MASSESPEQAKVDWARRQLEFEELRAGVSAQSTIEYFSKFGTRHLSIPQHALGDNERYDLDILAIIGAVIVLLYLLLIKLPTYLIAKCCCKK